MTEIYYLWSGPKQGWVAAVGTSTQLEMATKFTRSEALARMNRTKDHNGEPTLLPVNSADLA